MLLSLLTSCKHRKLVWIPSKGKKSSRTTSWYDRIKILLANSKSGERYHKKGHFSLLGGEYGTATLNGESAHSLCPATSSSPPAVPGGGVLIWREGMFV